MTADAGEQNVGSPVNCNLFYDWLTLKREDTYLANNIKAFY